MHFHRDLSQFEFNKRVLFQAKDKNIPLLERVRFLDIFRSNWDEFFMKRVGPLWDVGDLQTYQAITSGLKPLLNDAHDLWDKELLLGLKKIKIVFIRWEKTTPSEKKYLIQYFKKHIFPLLTPLSVDAGHPFPYISNLSKSIGVELVHPSNRSKYFARIKISRDLPAWIKVSCSAKGIQRWIGIENIILNCLPQIFSNMEILNSAIFRVTRDAALRLDDVEQGASRLEAIEEELQEKKFAPVTRLEISPNAGNWIIQFLIKELDITPNEVFTLGRSWQFHSLQKICDLPYPQHKYSVFRSRIYPWESNSLFTAIKKRDHLPIFPFDSFRSTVMELIRQAVDDSDVKVIKITLYRTDADGELIDLLLQAAQKKIQVAVVIELQARFDEERNIKWAQRMEEQGIHVSYGVAQFKTHAKMLLIIRKEKDNLCPYFYIGSGNFNVNTSRIYTDVGIFSANPTLAFEVLQIFNYLTGIGTNLAFDQLLVAPFNMRDAFIGMIHQEIKNKKKNLPCGIIAKMNALEDPEIIKHLLRASQEGVPVQLIIRGICCLNPKDSPAIRVTSIVGRFLEHSRIFWFRNGELESAKGKFYLGSADWMKRNLSERIEVICPIIDYDLKTKLWKHLKMYLQDNQNAWNLTGKGRYKKKNAKRKKFNAFLEQMK